jgi:hypothetical protein
MALDSATAPASSISNSDCFSSTGAVTTNKTKCPTVCAVVLSLDAGSNAGRSNVLDCKGGVSLIPFSTVFRPTGTCNARDAPSASGTVTTAAPARDSSTAPASGRGGSGDSSTQSSSSSTVSTGAAAGLGSFSRHHPIAFVAYSSFRLLQTGF